MAKSVLSAEHFHDESAALAFVEARIGRTGRCYRVESVTAMVA